MISEPTAAERVVSAGMPRWRVAAIALVVLLATGIGAVLGMTLTGNRGAGLGASAQYVPASAPIYLEARLDLPGPQRANLRSLIARFPEADADALLTDALATTLDDALDGSGFSYSADLAPWFDGRAAVAVLGLPSMTSTANAVPSAVVLLGVRDPALASGAADRVRAAAEAQGATFTSSEAHGTTIWSAAPGSVSEPMAGDAGFAYALTDDQLILGSTADAVTAALDVHAGDGAALGDRAEVRDLGGHLPAEVAGVMTMDLESMLADLRTSLSDQMPALGSAYEDLLGSAPPFMMASVSFEADAVRFDSVSAVASGDAAPANSTRDLADQVPADAILFADAGAVGDRLAAVVGTLQTVLGTAGSPMSADQLRAALGGDLTGMVSWIGDAAVAAGVDGSDPYAGLILEALDADAAAQRMGQLRALAGLAALDESSGISVSTDTVAGVDVTSVGVSESGAPGVVVQWAVDGDRVVIGLGDQFVGRVLELDPADSLGATTRFAAAADRFGADNAGLVFVDLAALRDALAAQLPPSMGMQYDQVAPMLAGLDYLVATTSAGGGAVVQRMALVLR